MNTIYAHIWRLNARKALAEGREFTFLSTRAIAAYQTRPWHRKYWSQERLAPDGSRV
jgi:hypothetical protein